MELSERISALLDDAGDHNDHAALAEIAQDPGARQTWARYQLIGDSLRGTGVQTSAVFSTRVMTALAHEALAPLETSNVTPLQANRWRPRAAVGLAAAATVAAFLFSGGSVPPPAEPSRALAAQGPRAILQQAPIDSAQVSALSAAEYQRRINSYLVNFNEQRAQLGVPRVLPYVRVVDFEAAPQP